MGLLSFEHSPLAYRSDFIVYGLAVLAMAAWLVAGTPRGDIAASLGGVLTGLLLWTALEYVLHRWVLHGLEPFRHWHAVHHQRPQARIGSPTLLTAALFTGLIYLPAQWLASRHPSPLWGSVPERALTLGVIAGYLLYSVLHHVLHHVRHNVGHHAGHHAGHQAPRPGPPRGPARWLQERRRWHAQHHRGQPVDVAPGTTACAVAMPPASCFGVTSGFWDRVLGSDTVRSRTDSPGARP